MGCVSSKRDRESNKGQFIVFGVDNEAGDSK